MQKTTAICTVLLVLLLVISLYSYFGLQAEVRQQSRGNALGALLHQTQAAVFLQLNSAQQLMDSRKSSSIADEKQALRQSLESRDTLNGLWQQLSDNSRDSRETEDFIRDLQYEVKTMEGNMQDVRGGPESRHSLRKVQEQGRILLAMIQGQLLQLQQRHVQSEQRCRTLAHLWFWVGLALLAGLAGTVLQAKLRRQRILANYLALSHDLGRGDGSAATPQDKSANQAALHDLGQALELLFQRFREESRHKDKFFASMSHEIRTPLNGLVGFLSNLSETPLNDQQKQYLRIIESSARSLMQIINEVLDYSKIQAGQLALEEIAFDLRDFLEERIAVARQLARNKSLKVILDFPGADQLIVRTDPGRLRQILDNLLSNAVKFTDRGEVILEVRQQDSQDDQHLRLAFAVRDSGVGIPFQIQQKLFQPFAQADDTIARRYGGTGLGLSISAALVKLLGSKLSLQSRPGEGSCFFFTLQLMPAKPEEQVRISELYRITLPRTELKKHWALLVDDTPTNLFLLETICQSVGLPYRTAVNGREALELCQQQRFDLIFMDIQMPIMDGYTAIREIRKLPNSGMTHIIALTASAFQEDIDQALGAGSTGFIPKPFERDQLLLCIADALGMTPERKIREPMGPQETAEGAIVRRMHDFMREQYQISLGEIKMILAQTVTDWRPVLDNLATYSQQGNSEETIAILQRLKGQLVSVGLLDQSEQTVAIMDSFRSGDRAQAQAQVVNLCQTLTRIFKTLEQEVTVNN